MSDNIKTWSVRISCRGAEISQPFSCGIPAHRADRIDMAKHITHIKHHERFELERSLRVETHSRCSLHNPFIMQSQETTFSYGKKWMKSKVNSRLNCRQMYCSCIEKSQSCYRYYIILCWFNALSERVAWVRMFVFVQAGVGRWSFFGWNSCLFTYPDKPSLCIANRREDILRYIRLWKVHWGEVLTPHTHTQGTNMSPLNVRESWKSFWVLSCFQGN